MSSDLSTPINLDNALVRLGNRHKLLIDMMNFFLEDSVDLLKDLDAAFEKSDLASVCRASHSLKGLAATFDASETVSAALSVEQMSKRGETVGLGEAIELLRDRVSVLCEVLKTEMQRLTA